MGYRAKHYQSDWFEDDPSVFDDEPSVPMPTKKKATPEIGVKTQEITIDRKTGQKTYGPQENLPVTRIKVEDF